MNDLVTTRECVVLGQVEWSSNATLVVQFPRLDDPHTDGSQSDGSQSNDPQPDGPLAIYKPAEGEAPLDDFAHGLWQREIAAYELSQQLGWPNIPQTIEFVGPFGIGSLQRFIDHNQNEHFFTFGESREMQHTMQQIAAFDLIVNNTDRKAGHILLSKVDGRTFCIDHGLCFNPSTRLRTVIWKFGGEEIPQDIVDDLAQVASSDLGAIAKRISDDDMAAFQARLENVVTNRQFPELTSNRQLPWPLV